MNCIDQEPQINQTDCECSDTVNFRKTGLLRNRAQKNQIDCGAQNNWTDCESQEILTDHGAQTDC